MPHCNQAKEARDITKSNLFIGHLNQHTYLQKLLTSDTMEVGSASFELIDPLQRHISEDETVLFSHFQNLGVLPIKSNQILIDMAAA
jgi:hypothetical protein